MGHTWRLRELHRRETIRPYLERDRFYAAYALGDLEPALFPQCRWWLADGPAPEADGGWALVLCFEGLEPPAVVCMGAPAGVRLLLGEAPLPPEIYLVCRPQHLPVARSSFHLPSPKQMARLVLEPGRFQLAPSAGAERLHMEDLAALSALYAVERGAADAFAPYQLATGVFCGIRVRGALVSVAGTHLIALGEGIAALGNVSTHPEHRRRGYAAACTSMVCVELLAQNMVPVLNVGTGNRSALALYRRLGFREHCIYYEVIARGKRASARAGRSNGGLAPSGNAQNQYDEGATV
jgi:ribosomal protein S18 acetylase RimI-like enzyme